MKPIRILALANDEDSAEATEVKAAMEATAVADCLIKSRRFLFDSDISFLFGKYEIVIVVENWGWICNQVEQIDEVAGDAKRLFWHCRIRLARRWRGTYF